jgi:hypothetical protein
MDSDEDTRRTSPQVGCPIRRSRDHRSLASPPGFSQRATSFLASQCQGIHQMPFVALDPSQRRRRAQEQNPHARQPSHAKTLPRTANPKRAAIRGHTTTLSSPFNQHRTQMSEVRYQNSEFRYRKTSDLFDLREPAAAPSRCPVEVIGIEPTTSCLQSRRSPN